MASFEYTTVTWGEGADAAALNARLNQLGGLGWEAVSMVTRGMDAPMAGMGATVVPDIVILLKRTLPERRKAS